MFKYTVIVPHKDIPLLLKRCLDSIPNRDDIQILVIDDASVFDNRTKAKSYCYEKDNVEYIQCEESKGAGKARNIGMERAHGQYIIFSDSDDFFESSFWDVVDSIMDNTKADIVYFKDRAVDSETLNGIYTRNSNNRYIDDVLTKKRNSEDVIRFFHIVPWGKVFRRQFIVSTGIHFEEIMAGNDVMFSTKTGYQAERIQACPQVMYVVTRRQGSLVNTKNVETCRCRFMVMLRQNKFVESIGKNRYAFNVIKYLLGSFRMGGIHEFLWCLKEMKKQRVNPFNFLRRFV